jgi:hypothetical protein
MLPPVLRCGPARAGSAQYRCTKQRQGSVGKDPIYACRDGRQPPSDHLDDAIGELVIAMTRHADRLRRRCCRPSKAATAATAEAEKLRTRLESLTQLVAAGDLEPADFAAAAREVRNRLAAVEQRIVQAAGTPTAAALVSSGDVGTAWEAATVDTRRAVVTEVIDRIVINPARPGPFSMQGIDISWKDR